MHLKTILASCKINMDTVSCRIDFTTINSDEVKIFKDRFIFCIR